MPINAWWAGDPDERYWIEITDREDLGANLIAPQRTASGQETASYTLVSHVRPGDVVFHWWKPPGQGTAIVGFSTVTGEAFESSLTWQAQDSAGISAQVPGGTARRVA